MTSSVSVSVHHIAQSHTARSTCYERWWNNIRRSAPCAAHSIGVINATRFNAPVCPDKAWRLRPIQAAVTAGKVLVSDFLAKRHGSCAVVGASSDLLGSGFGAEIDAHDTILRAHVHDWLGLERDLGSRTSGRFGMSKFVWPVIQRLLAHEQNDTVFVFVGHMDDVVSLGQALAPRRVALLCDHWFSFMVGAMLSRRNVLKVVGGQLVVTTRAGYIYRKKLTSGVLMTLWAASQCESVDVYGVGGGGWDVANGRVHVKFDGPTTPYDKEWDYNSLAGHDTRALDVDILFRLVLAGAVRVHISDAAAALRKPRRHDPVPLSAAVIYGDAASIDDIQSPPLFLNETSSELFQIKRLQVGVSTHKRQLSTLLASSPFLCPSLDARFLIDAHLCNNDSALMSRNDPTSVSDLLLWLDGEIAARAAPPSSATIQSMARFETLTSAFEVVGLASHLDVFRAMIKAEMQRQPAVQFTPPLMQESSCVCMQRDIQLGYPSEIVDTWNASSWRNFLARRDLWMMSTVLVMQRFQGHYDEIRPHLLSDCV